MKKNLLWAALAAMLAVGCQETEVTNGAPKAKAITFSTEVGKGTKALISTTTYPTDVPFGVFAYALTGANWENTSPLTNPVMDKVEISHQTDKWKATTGSYYWPTNATTKLSFFAYSPKSATPVPTFTAGEGVTFTNYDNDGVTDLMYASAKDLQGGSVPLTFNHAMTQVLFTAKRAAAYDGITIKITSIRLNDISSKSTFKVLGSPQWTTPSASVFYVVYNNGIGQNVTTAATQVGSALVMIPQTSSALTFTVVYEISGTGVATERVTKSIAFGNDWSPNQKISYNLTLSLNEITFNPEVTAWDAVTDKSHDVQ